MKKLKKKNELFKNDATKEEKREAWDTLSRFGIIALLTFSFILFYYVAERFNWYAVFWIYFGALAALSAAYVIWNRGFTRSEATMQNLPDDWSKEKKESFIAEGKKWKEDSKLLLYLIIPLLFTFFVDIVKLFIVDVWF